MSESIYLIYKHTSPSGKSYIGQTNNLQRRTRQHRHSSKSPTTFFHKAIRKYGFENFSIEILAENITLETANIIEPKFIFEHNILVPNGYNLVPGGLNHTHNPISNKKVSDSKIGIPRSIETKQKISIGNKGKKVSIESRLKMSKSRNIPVLVDNIKYDSITQAATILNIPLTTLWHRVKHKLKGCQYFSKIGLE
jgi:group I intron endonuclease